MLWQNQTLALEQISKLWPLGQIYPLPDFVNKVLLGHRHARSFRYGLWLLLCYKVRLTSCHRDSMASKA